MSVCVCVLVLKRTVKSIIKEHVQPWQQETLSPTLPPAPVVVSGYVKITQHIHEAYTIQSFKVWQPF